jgi:hypothetical protein
MFPYTSIQLISYICYRKTVRGYSDGHWLWIGANDAGHEGIFTNLDGIRSDYTNWGDLEPNNVNGECWSHIRICMLMVTIIVYYKFIYTLCVCRYGTLGCSTRWPQMERYIGSFWIPPFRLQIPCFKYAKWWRVTAVGSWRPSAWILAFIHAARNIRRLHIYIWTIIFMNSIIYRNRKIEFNTCC